LLLMRSKFRKVTQFTIRMFRDLPILKNSAWMIPDDL
jgi:hypothetical protein